MLEAAWPGALDPLDICGIREAGSKLYWDFPCCSHPNFNKSAHCIVHGRRKMSYHKHRAHWDPHQRPIEHGSPQLDHISRRHEVGCACRTHLSYEAVAAILHITDAAFCDDGETLERTDSRSL